MAERLPDGWIGGMGAKIMMDTSRPDRFPPMPNPQSPLSPHGLSSAAAREKPVQVCAAKHHMPME